MGAVRPSEAEVLMQVTETVALRATCNRRKVGAVLSLDGRVLSHGYNGSPSGLAHCGEECFTGGPQCQKSIHAEANAIIWAARNGIRIEGATAFTTLNPCLPCAGLLVQAGVSRVYYRDFYRSAEGNQLLEDAGIQCEMLLDGKGGGCCMNNEQGLRLELASANVEECYVITWMDDGIQKTSGENSDLDGVMRAARILDKAFSGVRVYRTTREEVEWRE